jgi:hypothetical protein
MQSYLSQFPGKAQQSNSLHNQFRRVTMLTLSTDSVCHQTVEKTIDYYAGCDMSICTSLSAI